MLEKYKTGNNARKGERKTNRRVLMKRILVVLAMLAVAGFAFAASASTTHVIDISVIEVVAVGLDDTALISLSTVAPGTAGSAPTGQSDNSKYLRYTAVNSGVQTRRITAQMSVAAPSGTALQVNAAIGAGGAGVQGSSVGNVTLNNTVAQDIITGIGSCYTDVGGSDGANLTYTLLVPTPGALVVGATASVTITLTLTDGA